MKQEYRKASAEALGHKDISEPQATAIIVLIDGVIYEWQPDKDANQMLMVLDWMRDNDIKIMDIWAEWYYHNADIKLATMKAFMSYIKQQP